MRRIGALAVLVVAMAAVWAAGASAANLNQQFATLQIQGTFATNWTIPTTTHASDCEVERKHGEGHDILTYKSSGHAQMTIVDSGGNGSIAFQPPANDLATLTHKAPDFGLALDQRTGTVETDYEGTGALGCGPPDPTFFADATGCGSAKINWMAKPIDVNGKFYPTFYPFVPNRLALHCPFFTVSTQPAPLPFTRLPARELRSALSKKHGKIIIHGSERFQSPVDATHDWTATTTITWKAILIRAHP